MVSPSVSSQSVHPLMHTIPYVQQTDRHTDHATCDICSNMLHLMHYMQAMQTKNCYLRSPYQRHICQSQVTHLFILSGFLSYSYLSLTHYLAQAPLKLRPYGAIQISLLLLIKSQWYATHVLVLYRMPVLRSEKSAELWNCLSSEAAMTSLPAAETAKESLLRAKNRCCLFTFVLRTMLFSTVRKTKMMHF